MMKLHWYEAHGIGKRASWIDAMTAARTESAFVLCIGAAGHDDLEKSKVYAVIPDDATRQEGYLRVVDDSGEDYLYPADCFVPIDVPAAAREVLGRIRNR